MNVAHVCVFAGLLCVNLAEFVCVCIPLQGQVLGEAIVLVVDPDAGQLGGGAAGHGVQATTLEHLCHNCPTPRILLPLDKHQRAWTHAHTQAPITWNTQACVWM